MIDLDVLFGAEGADDAQALSFRVFPKRGKARWMLETSECRPWHLKTWPRANLRARLIFRVAWAMSYLGLHLPSRRVDIMVAPGSPYAELRRHYSHLGVFLGTPGPNRKIVVFAGRGDSSVYVKIPLGPSSGELARTEEATLIALASDPDLAPIVPRVCRVAGQLAVESLEQEGARHGIVSYVELARVHNLLFARSRTSLSLSALRSVWADRAARLCEILPPVNHSLETRGKIDHARAAAERFLDGLDQQGPIDCYRAHGDFTRWNVLVGPDGGARILDWELVALQPKYFDSIHYVASAALLVTQRSSEGVLAEIRKACASGQWAISCCDDTWRAYVGLYFAGQVFYYAALYSRQEELHSQAILQLEIWGDILDRLTRAVTASQADASARPTSEMT